mmetsp:Transcript_37014/g.115227  ORF Transcript_37014/g.115227 Transcript_37014/m.115227 type:complete len:501 (+) Transcript_37014:345-1847(+)
MSHEQALFQCDSYIRDLGVAREAVYDTAGGAKMVAEGKLEGVGAICSVIAAAYYGLEVLEQGIEDDANNFTRFLLLRPDPVSIPSGIPCKTSIAFTLEDNAGALFKAISAFAVRDVSLCKIESRPCKPHIMDKLERMFRGMSGTLFRPSREKAGEDNPPKRQRTSENTNRFKYIFYVDLNAAVDAPNTVNAIRHLQEMTSFFRVLGAYPCAGSLSRLQNLGLESSAPAVEVQTAVPKQRVGILGYGNFGQFLGKQLAKDCEVFGQSRGDYSQAAARDGVAWCRSIEELLEQRLDVLIISVSILSFESMVRKLVEALSKVENPSASKMLVVDVLSVKVHAKTTLLALLPESCDILCTHPMFGPESGKHGWNSLPFMFERVRLQNARRCEDHLKWWRDQGLRMIDMTCELHDECAADSQFVTHFTGRLLSQLGVRSTPINTKGFESLLQLVDNTCKDSYDLFYALFKYNPNSMQQLEAFEKSIKELSEDLRTGRGLKRAQGS